ncbi:MAG: hypothetical protein IT287_05380 [Bdellovibrionaceae bacterium]|nr:hypothetical protein [Pseudobdellovibrionaceae bacterium]
MQESKWKQHFTQFKDSNKSLPELLTAGELPIADYMKWATENYKIPFLSDDFFAQTKNFKLIIENPSAQWNEFFFPIHEWQGLLYVGCLEPQSFEYSKKTCMVLCSPTQLSLRWSKMESLQKTAIGIPLELLLPTLTEETPAGITPQLSIEKQTLAQPVTANKPATAAPPAKIVPAPLTTNTTTNPNTAAPVAKPIAASQAPAQKPAITTPATKRETAPPQTITTNPQRPPTPSIGSPSATPLRPTAPAAAKPAEASALPLTKFSLEDTKSELKTAPRTVPTPTKTNTPAKEAAAPAPKAPSAPPPATVKINPNFSQSNYNIPEITNVVRAQNKSSDTHFTSTKTIMPFPDRTTQFTFIRTVYSEQVIIDAKTKIQENNDPQDALISAFKLLKDYYKKLMWVVRDQKGYAFPIACNTEWEFTEEAWNLSMDFKTPNPFRIAKLTQKPYHGPISKNRASDEFFKQWGDGTYPDVLSIVPVKLHGKVFGYFVGCGKGPHFNSQQSIELMESVCNDLIVAFVRIHKDLTKAS